jgi:WD40 repeat protein
MLPRALMSVVVLSVLALFLLVPSIQSQNAAVKNAALMDALGDPLPDGAVARLGTLRFKHAPSKSVTIDSAVFSPDGTKLASLAFNAGTVRLWDADSGKEITGPWVSSGARYSAIGFTPDSSRLAVAIHPGFRPPNAAKNKTARDTIVLYDIAKASQIKTFSAPLQLVSAIAFANGGKTIVSAGDGIVRWWDMDSGKEQRTWQPFADEQPKPNENKMTSVKSFSSCALSPDASAIALQVDWRVDDGNRGFVQRYADAGTAPADFIGYELPSGKKYWQSSGKGPRYGKGHLAFSADGKRVAVVVGSERIEVRHGVNGKLMMNPVDLKELATGQPGALRPGGVALSADGRTLAWASGDANVHLYDTAEAAAPRKIATRIANNGPGSQAAYLQFAPGDKKLVVAVDADLQFYDTQTLAEVAGNDGHRGWVDHLSFSPDGTRLFTGLSGRSQVTGEYFGPNGEVFFLVMSGGARSAPPSPEQAAWDVATWKRVDLASARTPPYPNVGAMSLQRSLYASKTGQLQLFDLKSGQARASLLVWEKQPTGSGFFSPSGKHYVLVAGENERIYAAPSGKLVCKFAPVAGNQNRFQFLTQTPGDTSDTIAFSPDEKLVAQYARGDGLIRVYDTATGALRHTVGEKLEPDPNRPLYNASFDVAFSADNRLMASWSSVEKFLRVWDMDNGAELAYIATGDMQSRPKLAWSPDGRVLAFGENKIHLLEMATLSIRRELPGHPDAGVRSLAFAPGSRLLASGGSDTTVLIWDMLRPAGSPPANAALDRAALETNWRALANDDARAAYAALLQLVAAPGDSIPWIKERVSPEPPIDPKRIEKLIEDLNDNRFKVRESATAELTLIGRRSVAAIDKALEAKPTLETQRRLQSIRKSATGPVLKGEKLQSYRAIEALEKMGTPEALELLRSLAGGAAGGLVTTQARDAVARLKQ